MKCSGFTLDHPYRSFQKGLTMRKMMLMLMLMLLLTVGEACAYDLPRVIAVLTGETISGVFGTSFSNIPDLNNDGCDELIIPSWGRQVEFFFGGREMNSRGDRHLSGFVRNMYITSYCNYLGNIIDRNQYMALMGAVGDSADGEQGNVYLGLFDLREGVFANPSHIFRRRFPSQTLSVQNGANTRPSDFTGDGISDLIAIETNDSIGWINIYFGGGEFDTIPDWRVRINTNSDVLGSAKYSTGFDFNSDGYHDLLIRYIDRYYFYQLYLGGSPMDTVPIFEFRYDHFQGIHTSRKMQGGFTMLQDVNNDGYDDIGIQYFEIYDDEHGPWDDTGYLIFFGGEDPDLEPDLDLQGEHGYFSYEAETAGGDFNGDGIGDIVTANSTAFYGQSEMHLYFGSRWMTGQADIIVNGEEDYGDGFQCLGQTLGGAGDYDGDGVDDWVAKSGHNAIVFAGNRDWTVSVSEDTHLQPVELAIDAYPNPFNNAVRISYALPSATNLKLAVFDLSGREVAMLANEEQIAGFHQVIWQAAGISSGVYFVRFEAGNSVQSRKLLLVK